MRAKSINGASVEEFRIQLSESMADGFHPTLAIVFLSVKQDIKAVCNELDRHGIAIFGVTTNGEFINEKPCSGSIAILLMEMNPAYFSIYLEGYPQKDYKDVASKIARRAAEQFVTPCFLIAGSSIDTDAEQLLFGIEEVIGEQVNVFGGMGGDDFQFTEQFVFSNNISSNNGVVVLALDETKIMIKGRATCGWKAMGTERVVTRSVGNHLYTIDNTPVLELTKKFSGIENLNKDNPKAVFEIATEFPLQLQRGKGDPVMRPGLVIDWEDGSFYCSGSIPEGSRVRFSLPPDLDVIEKVVEGLRELKQTEMPEADAVIVFSCAGRIASLGPLVSKEIEGVKGVWDVPIVGMFSNAELGRATGGNLEMHNLTTCCVVLKEK